MYFQAYLSGDGDHGLIHGNYSGDVSFFCSSYKCFYNTQVVVVNDGIECQVGSDSVFLTPFGDLGQVMEGKVDGGPCPHV